MNLTELFCHVDDFCQLMEANWQHYQLTSGGRPRQRNGELCHSEIMTLLIHFHQARTFLTGMAVQLKKKGIPVLFSQQNCINASPIPFQPIGESKGHFFCNSAGSLQKIAQRIHPLKDGLGVPTNLSRLDATTHSPNLNPVNFLVDLISGLIAYPHQSKKLSLQISFSLI